MKSTRWTVVVSNKLWTDKLRRLWTVCVVWDAHGVPINPVLGGHSLELFQGALLHSLLGPTPGKDKRSVVVEGRVCPAPHHKHEVLLRPWNYVPLFHLRTTKMSGDVDVIIQMTIVVLGGCIVWVALDWCCCYDFRNWSWAEWKSKKASFYWQSLLVQCVIM